MYGQTIINLYFIDKNIIICCWLYYHISISILYF